MFFFNMASKWIKFFDINTFKQRYYSAGVFQSVEIKM